MYRRSPDGEITTVVPKRRGVGGISIHADGGLVISGRNVCHVKDGETRVLFGDGRVGGFNDLFADAQGRVLVGSIRPIHSATADRRAGELWRIDGEDEAEVVYDGVGLVNGIGFSPDGTKLYHSDSAARQILVHDVDADGNVSNRARLRDSRSVRRTVWPSTSRLRAGRRATAADASCGTCRTASSTR